MHFGLHVSIAGGIFNAPANAAAVGCETFQMFTRSPRGGAAPKLTADLITQFKDGGKKHGFSTCYVHTPYYINLASSNSAIAAASVRIIREELERSSLLGVTAVMTHLGSAKDLGRAAALTQTIDGLKKVLAGYRGGAQFLIEIAAGSGNIMGDTFEEIAAILKGIKNNRVGVCLDTAHALASGYDLSTPAGVLKTFKAFDRQIGLERLALIHGNDSKTPIGSHVDRHENIGHGHIGLEGFRAIINHPKLERLDMILETPGDDGWDRKNLATVKKLRKK